MYELFRLGFVFDRFFTKVKYEILSLISQEILFKNGGRFSWSYSSVAVVVFMSWRYSLLYSMIGFTNSSFRTRY